MYLINPRGKKWWWPLLVLTLWSATLISAVLFYWNGIQGKSFLAFWIHGGITLALLMASIDVSGGLRQRLRCKAEAIPETASPSLRMLKWLALKPWLAWDFAFGVLIPPTLLAIDPVVFRAVSGSRPLLSEYRNAAYLLLPECALVLGAWMILKPRRLGACVSGVLSAGAVAAWAVGLAILPFSILLAFFLGGGLLGLLPFVTAFTFARRARRAWRLGQRGRPVGDALWEALGGAILAIAPALILQLATEGFPIPRSVAIWLR